MNSERTILKTEKARYKERLATQKHYIKELADRCKECGTDHDHIGTELMKAENDAQFYQFRLTEINDRLKALTPKAKAPKPKPPQATY
jgi:septal ring factor EnvC (AmiA/AmiB activator)